MNRASFEVRSSQSHPKSPSQTMPLFTSVQMNGLHQSSQRRDLIHHNTHTEVGIGEPTSLPRGVSRYLYKISYVKVLGFASANFPEDIPVSLRREIPCYMYKVSHVEPPRYCSANLPEYLPIGRGRGFPTELTRRV